MTQRNVHIDGPSGRSSQGSSIFKLLVAIVLLIFIAIGFFCYSFMTRPELPPPFEIKNYFGEVKVHSHVRNAWEEPVRGRMVELSDIIQTQKDSEIELLVSDLIRIRVKPDSQVEIQPPRLSDRVPTYWLNLQKGSVFVATGKKFKDQKIKVFIPNKALEADEGPGLFEDSSSHLIAEVEQGSFLVDSNRMTGDVWVGVLRGSADVTAKNSSRKVTVHSLEKLEYAENAKLEKPKTVARGEWNRLKEAYELFEKSAAVEAEQLDLSKKAGNMFYYLFDHGTFFTPKIGYALREFFLDEASGEVFLDLEYDVFPQGSFVGMYLKARDLDLSKFRALQFDVRRKPGENFPDSVRIEVKSGGNVIRGFAAKMFRKEWETKKFPLHFNKETNVDELTFVFANDKVGPSKQGVVQLRNFTLIPADDTASVASE